MFSNYVLKNTSSLSNSNIRNITKSLNHNTYTHSERSNTTKRKFNKNSKFNGNMPIFKDYDTFATTFEDYCNILQTHYNNYITNKYIQKVPSPSNNEIYDLRPIIKKIKFSLSYLIDKRLRELKEKRLRELKEKRGNQRVRENENNIEQYEMRRNISGSVKLLRNNSSVEVNNRKKDLVYNSNNSRKSSNIFDIYLETLIVHHLYTYSDDKYKNAVSKQYYLLMPQNQEVIRIYKSHIRNTVSFEEYIKSNYNNNMFITNFLTIIKKICVLLNYFQLKFGLVHNNLTLNNILLDDGLNPYFVDFRYSCAELKIKLPTNGTFSSGNRRYICIDAKDLYYLKINKDERDVDNISKCSDLFYLFLDIMKLFNGLNNSEYVNKLKNEIYQRLYNLNNNQNFLNKISLTHNNRKNDLKKMSKDLNYSYEKTRLSKNILLDFYNKFIPLNMLKNIKNINITPNNSKISSNNSKIPSKMTNKMLNNSKYIPRINSKAIGNTFNV